LAVGHVIADVVRNSGRSSASARQMGWWLFTWRPWQSEAGLRTFAGFCRWEIADTASRYPPGVAMTVGCVRVPRRAATSVISGRGHRQWVERRWDGGLAARAAAGFDAI
jgi:hypothetical protein